MYHYYVHELDIHNLLWVWNCRSAEGYPGDAYVDVVSLDSYLPSFQETDYSSDYEALLQNTTPNKIAALAEVGYIPDVDILSKSKIPWAYYMTWSKDFCLGEQYNSTSHLQKMYASNYAITL